MPSIRKQKGKDKRSRQSDVMSDLENQDVMLEKFPAAGFVNHPDDGEDEVDLVSAGLQKNSNTLVEGFRSLLNSNSIGISE